MNAFHHAVQLVLIASGMWEMMRAQKSQYDRLTYGVALMIFGSIG